MNDNEKLLTQTIKNLFGVEIKDKNEEELTIILNELLTKRNKMVTMDDKELSYIDILDKFDAESGIMFYTVIEVNEAVENLLHKIKIMKTKDEIINAINKVFNLKEEEVEGGNDGSDEEAKK